jgi:6-phosphofructokinase 1
VTGVRRGYFGLLQGDYAPLAPEAVHDIIHRGGSMLLTARCEEFRAPEAPARAAARRRQARIEGQVCVGGEGSLRGCLALSQAGLPAVGVPATIDKDLPHTDGTIGFDTAVNTAVEAIDRVRDTAAAHERTFVVEVMGRHTGFIALAAGIASAAELVLVPEIPWTPAAVCDRLRHALHRGSRHHLVVVAEGAARGEDLAAVIERETGLETRVRILDHVQRGGSPSAADRDLATRLGAAALDFLLAGRHGVMAALRGGLPAAVPLAEVVEGRRALDPGLHALAESLSL